MLTNARRKRLELQGYRLTGEHSAVKICFYCKQAIRGKDVCYKNKFYGIKSWRCVQASVSLEVCNLRCNWCWRDVGYTRNYDKLDKPAEIVDGLIKEHVKLLYGFYGSENVDRKKLDESMKPLHIALSLTGETCLYPKLPELVDEILGRGMSCFIVSNGTMPEMVKKLVKHQPTQMYITLPAPDKEVYEKCCKPLIKDGWERIIKSLGLLGEFKRGVVRLTLAKEMNMVNANRYAGILKDVDFKFLEIKAAMGVGDSKYRMRYEQMPLHNEIVDFAHEICRLTGWKIVDEKEESRVVLVMRKDFKGRKLEF